MNEDYVSYELAKKLKECGFDEPCRHCYIVDKNTESNVEFTEYASKSKWNGARIGGLKYPYKHISVPSLYAAQKWLREKWDLHIDVYPIADCSLDADGQVCEEWNYWTFDIMHVMSTRKIVEDEEQYGSYEEALSAGLSVALELIKKVE